MAAVAVPLGTLVASLAGFAIARLPRRAALLLLGLTLVAAVVPASTLFVGRLVLFRIAGLTDSPVPLIAPALIGVSPLLVLLFAWSYHSVSGDVYDLAREAGLGPFRTWWTVAMPMRLPVVGVAAAIAFMVSWGNLTDPLLYVYDERWYTLPLGLTSLAQLPSTDHGSAVGRRGPRDRSRARHRVPHPTIRFRQEVGMSRFTRYVSVLVVFALALGAIGCEEAAEGPTRITVMVAGDPAEIDAYRAVVEGFDSSQDEVDAELQPLAERDELIARLGTSIAGGQPPDLFLMNYRFYGQFAARDALEPVGPFLDGSSVLSEGDFFETAMTPFRWDGEQTCLPQNVSSLVVYYNADLFRDAGVSVPASGWSWDEMVDAAERLTRDDDDDGTVDVYGLGVDPEIIRVAPLIWSNGGTLVDDETSPTRFALNGPAVAALERFLDLRTRGVTPTDEEAESEDFESRFLNGRLAMLMESRRVVPTLRTITDFPWDVAGFPGMDEPASVLHSDAYCMTAASQEKDAAWTFLEFALGPEGQRIAAESGRTVPSLRSVAETDAFLDPDVDPAHSEVFVEQIPFLRSVPVISTWPEIEDTVNGLLEEAYYGGGRALEVAIELTASTRGQFARAEG